MHVTMRESRRRRRSRRDAGLSHHTEETCDVSLPQALVLRRLADAQHPLPSSSTRPSRLPYLHGEPGASLWVPLACLLWWALAPFALSPWLGDNTFGVVLVTPFVVAWCLGYLDVKRIERQQVTETEGRQTHSGAGHAAGSRRDVEAHGTPPDVERPRLREGRVQEAVRQGSSGAAAATSYIGFVVAERGTLLLNAMAQHQSPRFELCEDAHHWVGAVVSSNRLAGRRCVHSGVAPSQQAP